MGHRYGAGLYFVTICTSDRRPLFGTVGDGLVSLTCAGRLAEAMWRAVPNHQPAVVLDAFVVMPDHIHVLFGIRPGDVCRDDAHRDDAHRGRRATACCGPTEDGATNGLVSHDGHAHDGHVHDGHTHDAPFGGATRPERAFGSVVPGTVPSIIRGYKSAVTRTVRLALDDPGVVVWQREYHDRVVRSHREAEDIRRYITENPTRWR